ncbi:cysteine synthase CysM [Natronogracilivirgula saccharolytica]|uniref:Cysteine synthase n=1 Tax=Natronogracilivirga saccharolytica TaxID=2812953 RepID=A0A8J7RTR5_9BACT|nr:cysteine synthase CysM [Natronogracilivirga saccharolytica]MBP3193739.1 cysteine synthase CysM [Natronogracilivirga saccharolytica]
MAQPLTLEDLIGNTPIVKLQHIPESPDVEIYCKLEGRNPGGSVKDRAAYGMISAALERGDISPGDKLVEATSGNTGIALAMIARLKNLHMTLIMPENSTQERIRTMRAYGAELILTPAEKTIEYSRTVAEEMGQSGEYYLLNQFANPDNYRMHYRTTGPEIWRDTGGRITHFVSSMGTTGTIMGVSRYLKEQNPGVGIVGVQPTEGSQIPGIRRWSPEFLPEIFESERVDRTIDVSENESVEMTRRMARDEGIFAGMSSGGCLSAAVRLAREIDSGVIVCITCDIGDRYLSSPLFEDSVS